MSDKQESGSSISLLKGAAKQLYESLQQMEADCTDPVEKKRIVRTKAQCRDLFLHMKNFVSTVLFDLENTREQLNRNSDQMLGQVSEQLNKVTESTQDAVQSVLNRLDTICERQNEVFDGLAGMKSKLGNMQSKQDSKALTEIANRLEGLENEIQMETFEIMSAMQFQDITSQQMQQANALINEAKDKLTDLNALLSLFRKEHHEQSDDELGQERHTYDPEATMKDREVRQQLANDIEVSFKEKNKD